MTRKECLCQLSAENADSNIYVLVVLVGSDLKLEKQLNISTNTNIKTPMFDNCSTFENAIWVYKSKNEIRERFLWIFAT